MTDRRKYSAFMDYCSSYLFADPTLEQEHAFYAGWNMRDRIVEEPWSLEEPVAPEPELELEDLGELVPEDTPHLLLLLILLASLAALLAAAISRA